MYEHFIQTLKRELCSLSSSEGCGSPRATPVCREVAEGRPRGLPGDLPASVSQWRWIRSVCLQAGNRRGVIFLGEGPAFGQGAHSSVTGPPGPRVGCLQLSNLVGEACPLPSLPPPLGCATTGRQGGAGSFASPFCSLTVSFLPSGPPPLSPPLPPTVPDLLEFCALPTPSQAQFCICSHGNSVLRMRKLYRFVQRG